MHSATVDLHVAARSQTVLVGLLSAFGFVLALLKTVRAEHGPTLIIICTRLSLLLLVQSSLSALASSAYSSFHRDQYSPRSRPCPVDFAPNLRLPF
ncbi:uncharacterized protein J3D65DRAFT_642350 [Phyllosticta citribraziliensis]|uniref:Uncharacterized protein n=1 Tax=Phyllosticta citribraziliensis TaxID=989973 RepID=A0ABR1L2V5_9PEZI